MDTPAHAAPPLELQPQTEAQRRRRQQPRRPRGGRNNPSIASSDNVVQQSHENQTQSTQSGRPSRPRRSENRRKNQPHVNGNSQRALPHGARVLGAASSRPFGGTLTTEADEISQDGSSVGARQTASSASKHRFPSRAAPLPSQKRRLSKSSAPDVTTRIHEDINNLQYECPICTNDVLRNSKIWSCRTCWTVFHLSCIKTWSSNAEATQNSQDGDTSVARLWRCPGCNLPQDVKPSVYTCWCEKDLEPRATAGIPPHSCGQTCGKSRVAPKACPHPCELICHAGPCPPCTSMGPTQSCFCGKQSVQKRCADTSYDHGWSCEAQCEDMMPCGEHQCSSRCHEGLCGACEVQIYARCYCGQKEQLISCCDKKEELPSSRAYIREAGEEVVETWTGNFDCNSSCERTFDCGNHVCQKPCHSLERGPTHCPRSPDVTTHCPCGKTDLAEITTKQRTSCTDPIPNCSRICGKFLSCGHGCQLTCHTGPCLPCLQNIQINCQCGRLTVSTICHQGAESTPQCTRICRTTLNCGRHECGDHCCPGERRATERLASKKKHRALDSPRPVDDGFEAEHICTRICGRLLKCGNHRCQELCHKGACGSCREAIFEELACYCGRTVLQPPLHCGAKAPPCRFECERPKSCGHPQVPHYCHFNNESCPKCPFLTEKECLCGKKTLKNQQCWFTDVHCGEICGKKLKCGSHTCRNLCHKPGECEDAAKPCSQHCGRLKKSCGHSCENPCHAPYPCREDEPCKHKIIVTCECQNNRQEMSCKASKTNEGNLKESLECNEECARLERNRKLAAALRIDPSTHEDNHVPYSSATLFHYQENVNWAQTQEREFRVLATSETEKRVRFRPMSSQQRAFLHNLADDFGFDSESLDPEPYRHVLIFKSPRFVSAPAKTIGDCVRILQKQRAAAADARNVAKSSNIREPYNGLLLTSARFALTIDELSTEIAAVQGPNPKLRFNITFLPSDEVALVVLNEDHTERTVDLLLKDLKLPLARAFTAHGFGSLQLCRLDPSKNVVRRETDSTSEGGWSQVAAKAAAPRQAPQPAVIGAKSSFTVLSGLNKKKQQEAQRKRKEAIVDDWEEAEMAAEEKEKMLLAAENELKETGVESHAVDDSPEDGIAEQAAQVVNQANPESDAAVDIPPANTAQTDTPPTAHNI